MTTDALSSTAVTLVGHDLDCLDPENHFRRLLRLRQQPHVDNLIGDLVLRDSLVFGVHRHLNIVAQATCVCAAIARLSGSVSEIWFSPVLSS